MFGKGRKVRIGFDWSGTTLKAVRLVFSHGKPRLTHAVTGTARNLTRAGSLLKQSGFHARGKDIRVSLPGWDEHIRQLDLPLQSDNDLRSFLPFEIRRHVPVPEEERLTLEHQVVRADEEHGRMSVLVAVSPWDGVDRYRDSLKRSGLSPGRIESAPLAGLNHLMNVRSEVREGSCWGLLDIGEEGSWLSFYREGGGFLCRTLPIGGETFTQELLDRAELSREEAEKVKRGTVTLTAIRPEWKEKPATLQELVGRTIDSLAENVRIHNSSFRLLNGPVRGLFLGGGGALLHGLDRILEKRLAIPVRLLDPFEGLELPPDWSEEDAESVLNVAPIFLTAVGLTAWWEQ